MNKRSFIKTGILGSFGALVPVGLLASNQKAANGVILRPHQQEVFDIFKNTDRDIFCFWGKGLGKTFLFNHILDSIPTIKEFLKTRENPNDLVNFGNHDGTLIVDYNKDGESWLFNNREHRRKIMFFDRNSPFRSAILSNSSMLKSSKQKLPAFHCLV